MLGKKEKQNKTEQIQRNNVKVRKAKDNLSRSRQRKKSKWAEGKEIAAGKHSERESIE